MLYLTTYKHRSSFRILKENVIKFPRLNHIEDYFAISLGLVCKTVSSWRVKNTPFGWPYRFLETFNYTVSIK